MTAREPRDLHNWEDLHNVSILTFSTAGVFQHNPSPDNKRITLLSVFPYLRVPS